MLQKYKFIFLFLCFLTIYSAYSQHQIFDSLANKLNRISNSKKTESLELLNNLYQIAYNHSDSSLFLARCLYEESIFNVYQGIVDTSMYNRIQAQLNQPSHTLLEHALLQSALGINLLTLGEVSEAFTLHLQALDKYKQFGDNRFTAKTLNSLGNICSQMSLISLAEYYYSEAMTFLIPEWYEYYITKSNIFKLLAKHNMQAAVDSVLQLIETVERDNRQEILPLLYLNIGSLLLNIYPEKALTYFSKMQKLDIDNPKMIAAVLCNMGMYYFVKKDYPEALNYLRNTQKIIEKNNDFETLSEVYGLLSQVFEEQHQLDSALYYLKKSYELTQKLRASTAAIETHQKYITTVLEASKKDLMIAEQTINLKNKQFTLIIIVSGFTILLILMFLLLVNQQKLRKASENRELNVKLEHEKKVQQYEKRQRQLEKEKQKEVLDAKTREITSYSMLVSNKNNLLKQILELSTQAINNKENTEKSLTKIEKFITSNLSVDEEWENFKMHFDKVHPHFFKKLKRMCNDLTEENLKMSAYIKMGMTTKQIAQLLNIANNSVTISRHRIKKKLKLPEKESLSRFINSL